MKIRHSLCLLPFFLTTAVAPYSTLWVGGVGEPLHPASARGLGMGGVSIAIPYHIAQTNPACLSLDNTSYSLTGLQELVYSSRADENATASDFRLPQLCIAYPLPWSSAIGAKYAQEIDADFAFSQKDTVYGEPYTHELSRDGAIAEISIGLSKSLHPLTVGVRGCMNFGSFFDEQRIDFDSPEYTESNDELTREFRGYGYEVGLLLRLAALHVGALYRAESEVADDLTLPASYGVGVSYSFGRTLVGIDYTSSLWQQTQDEYEDAYAAAVGCEYTLGSSRLRAGYRYSSSYYNQIKQHTVTAGLGFPLGKGNAGFEVAIEAGLRRSSDADDLDEKLLRAGFTFWGLERWGRRTTYP
jgi:hypothetical protein